MRPLLNVNTNKKYSEINSDETIVFFRTSAYLNTSETVWNLPIHAWIYEPQNSRVRKAAFQKLLKETYGLIPDNKTQLNFTQRVNLLFADNKKNRVIYILMNGKKYALPRSKANGHIETILQIPVEELNNLSTNIIKFDAVMEARDNRSFSGECLLIESEGKSILSDIDDTIKLSYVTNRKQLLKQTFLNDFTAVDGMSGIYQNWAAQGASFHYVSSSPWHLYAPITDFLAQYDFPWATVSLKKIRFKDKSLLDLFKKGTATKPQAIEAILTAYPKRLFTLIGDSGEQDAEVYAGIARKYPQQIQNIYIRNINDDLVDNEKYKLIFSGIDESIWQVFLVPSEIEF